MENSESVPSDEDLARALQRGDTAALDALVTRYQRRVFAVAYRMTSNREDALDAAQDIFLKAYRKIHTWQPVAGFRPWLMRLAVNHCIDLLRRRKGRTFHSLDETYLPAESAGSAVEPHAPSTERQVHADEIGLRVKQALEALSPAQRTVFTLRHYEGWQLAEIAGAMGCTTGSVKVHLFRALRKLQIELKDLHEP